MWKRYSGGGVLDHFGGAQTIWPQHLVSSSKNFSHIVLLGNQLLVDYIVDDMTECLFF